MNGFKLDDEYLKERYDFELERKDKLTDALAFPVGILTALTGGVALLAQNFSYKTGGITTAFISIVVGDFFAFLVCVVFLVIAYHSREYRYIERLKELYAHLHKLREYYSDGPGDEGAEELFEEQFRYRIIEAADRNALSNDKRTGYLERARFWLIAVIVFSIAAGIVYVADAVYRPEEPTPVIRIENFTDLAKELQNMAKTPASQPQPQRPSPPPEFPQNRILREGTIPKK